MKTSTATMALVVGLALPAAVDAQLFSRPGTTNPRTVPAPPRTSPVSPDAPRDPNVLKNNVVIPEPVNPADLPPPAIPLPVEPIEPYLLTKQNGPFMVLAHTFRGPNSEKYAQALAMELRIKWAIASVCVADQRFPRQEHDPQRAAHRLALCQPAPDGLPREVSDRGRGRGPRRQREVARRLGRSSCIGSRRSARSASTSFPNIWTHRKGDGLKRAIGTTNPYVPAEELFVRKPDVMIQQMNQGPHSLFNCQGRYTLQVAEFTGRAAVVNRIGGGGMLGNLSRSPLASAAEDAEKLAAALARDKQVMQLGARPYVFHSRTSSKVLMGSFETPNDPNAIRLHDDLIKRAGDLNNRGVTDVLIVPATALSEVARIEKGDDVSTITHSESAPVIQRRAATANR